MGTTDAVLSGGAAIDLGLVLRLGGILTRPCPNPFEVKHSWASQTWSSELARLDFRSSSSIRAKAFEIVFLTVNSVRKAIDDGTVRFYPADVRMFLRNRTNKYHYTITLPPVLNPKFFNFSQENPSPWDS